MNISALCDALGVERSQVATWIEEGLPCEDTEHGLDFSEDEVATWLLANEKAVVATQQIATSISAAARELGLNRNTLARYFLEPGFPSTDKTSLPLDDIRDWIATHKAAVDVVPTSSGTLSIRDQRDLLRLQKEQEALIDVDVVKRHNRRVHAFAINEFQSIPSRVESRLPGGLEPSVLDMIRNACDQTVKNVCQIMGDLLNDFGDDDA